MLQQYNYKLDFIAGTLLESNQQQQSTNFTGNYKQPAAACK
jgi:hypothetical protein